MTEIRVSLYDRTIEWDTMEDDSKNRHGLNDAIKRLDRTQKSDMTYQCAVFVSRHDIGITEGTEDLAVFLFSFPASAGISEALFLFFINYTPLIISKL